MEREEKKSTKEKESDKWLRKSGKEKEMEEDREEKKMS